MIPLIMREAFRHTLEQFQHVARERSVPGISAERIAQLTAARDWEMEKAVRSSRVPNYIQKEVFELQLEKARIMRRLKDDLRRIDAGEAVDKELPGALEASVVDGVLVARWKGCDVPVTLGTIIADMDWEVYYRFDASVPRSIQKRYLLELAKGELFRIAQKQIAVHEAANPGIDWNLRQGIPGILALERSMQYGHLAERMTYGLMRRLEVDADPGFRVLRADAYHDVVQKIDFLLSVPSWLRGVRAEIVEDQARIVEGFQLTINPKASALRKKAEQIRSARPSIEGRLRDVSLVRFSRERIVQAFARWQELGHPPGGPQAQLPPEGIREIVTELLQGIVSQEALASIQASALDLAAKDPDFLKGERSPDAGAVSSHVRPIPVPVIKESAQAIEKAPPVEAIPIEKEAKMAAEQREALFEAFREREQSLREGVDRVDMASLLQVHDPKGLARLAHRLDADADAMEDLLEMRGSLMSLGDKRKTFFAHTLDHLEKKIPSVRRRAYVVKLLGAALEHVREEFLGDIGGYPGLLGVKMGDALIQDWNRVCLMHERGHWDQSVVTRYRKNLKNRLVGMMNAFVSRMGSGGEGAIIALRHAAGCIVMHEMLERLETDALGAI